MIASHARPESTAALNTNIFPRNPAVGGIPSRDSSPRASRTDSSGALRAIPANPLIMSLPVLLVMAMIAKNTARLVTAYATR